MKKIKIISFLSLAISFLYINVNTNTIHANEENLYSPQIEIDSPIGLLMEYSTGQIIYSKNINERKYPASMTKMIGIFLILEQIEENKISYNDIVTVSNNAASMGGSQVFL